MMLVRASVALIALLQATAWGGARADQDSGQSPGQDSGHRSDPGAIESWLAALHSDSAAERSRAQRALEAALEWRDFDLLRAAALPGDAEVGRRLVEVLAADERRLELAVRLATDSSPVLRELGLSALAELISRWTTGKHEPGMSAVETLAELDGKFDRVLVLDTRESATLRTAIDQIARFADRSPPLVVDPAWNERPPARPAATESVLEGDLERLLVAVTRRSGAAWESFGFARDTSAPWIFIGEPDRVGGKAAHELWIDWCLAVVRPGAALKSPACARALACTAWPAALSWLEARWLELGDVNALEGMVAAADRGRVAGALSAAAAQRELFARTQREVERNDPAADARASEIARALAAALRRGAGGDSVDALALDWLGAASSGTALAQRWLALVVLEGDAGASAAARERVASIVASEERGAVGPATRFQALRTLAAWTASGASPRAPAIGDAAGLWSWAAAHGYGSTLLELCGELDAAPPAKWADPALLPEAWGVDLRAFVCEWWLTSSDAHAAARNLSAWLARCGSDDADEITFEAFAERLGSRIRKGERKRIESVLALTRAEPGVDARKLEELEILAGSPSTLASDAVAARRLESAPASRRELMCLAALAAAPRGAEVRTAVIASLGSELPLEARVSAVDRALLELRRAREVTVERAFVTAVRTAIRTADRSVQSRLRVDQWPPPVRPEPISVRLLDRVLDRDGL